MDWVTSIYNTTSIPNPRNRIDWVTNIYGLELAIQLSGRLDTLPCPPIYMELQVSSSDELVRAHILLVLLTNMDLRNVGLSVSVNYVPSSCQEAQARRNKA